MNINRHNYETLFLLYVDNELSAAERKSVEQFVEEHTDLRSELEFFLETTLPSETISFNAKSLLYKSEADQDALQENLLLHLDNELDAAAASKMKSAITADSSIEKEWNLLQQTKLDTTERIVFENKDILYRHEKDRVISMRWWRVAAAAVLLFGCLYTGISLLKNNKTGDDKVAIEEGKTSSEKQTSNTLASNSNSSGDTLTINTGNIVAEVNETGQNAAASATILESNVDNHNTIIKDGSSKDSKNAPSNIPLENINNSKRNEIIVSTVLHQNSEPVSAEKIPVETRNSLVKENITAPESPIVDYTSVPATPDNYARAAIMNEADDGSDKILYVNESGATKSKLGGLFRKVKRVIERNTNIKTANGIRIAGFEIAAK